MHRMRTHEEVDALIELARTYYAERAAYQFAGAEGRLSPSEDAEFQRRLNGMDERIEQLKSNNELERCRGERITNIISLQFEKKAAR
jgi:hypothetical protein